MRLCHIRSQTNTQTKNVRTCRKTKVLIAPSIPIQPQQGSISTSRTVFIWQFLENDGLWKDLSPDVASKLEPLAVSGSVNYSFGQWSYSVTKISADECTQLNESTRNQRDLRRILFDKQRQKRIVWEFQDSTKKNGWCCVDDNALNAQLYQLQNGQSINYQRGQWEYCISKVDEQSASQKNVKTNTVRAYRLTLKDKSQMDANWKSKAKTNNQNNAIAYRQQVQQQQQQQRLMSSSFYRSVDTKKADEVVLDPNDVQNIAMNVRE